MKNVFSWGMISWEMCSSGILRQIPRKFWCVLVSFCLSKKTICSCTNFDSLWNLMCSLKELYLLLENSYLFLLHPSLLENLMCYRNLFKKVASGKEDTYFSNIARRLLLTILLLSFLYNYSYIGFALIPLFYSVQFSRKKTTSNLTFEKHL